ncbi:MAG: N-acyl amino acid synthase FeeM domain-containing protein, partial [Telluria sp.]
ITTDPDRNSGATADELVTDPTKPGTQDISRYSEDEDRILNQDSYGIRLLDTPEGRNSASMLINKMYAWRGYAGSHAFTNDPNRITLTASDKGDVVGTVTIGIDSEVGLAGDMIFKEELDRLRAGGARLCEFTKLAFDTSVRSKTALANLFHLAVLYARDLHECTDIVIEINPRHRRFYEHMLGFKREGDLKMNPRVNAPAYLLRVNLAYVTEQIQKHGGTFASEPAERSFYPFFFSPREEEGIRSRLLNIDGRQSSGSH